MAGHNAASPQAKAGQTTIDNVDVTVVPTPVKPVFEDVYFAVIPSKYLSDDKIKKLTTDLIHYGATHCPLSSSQLRNVTHLVSSTSDFPAYHDAVEGFIHVVTPQWVQQSILKKKTANPRQFSPDPRLFLSDVVLTFADDIPTGDKDAIIGGLNAMGGNYSPQLTSLVTHIVALGIDNQVCKIALAKSLRSKIVLPHWFDDCLKLGKKISHDPYLLPDPPILSAIPGQSPSKYTTPRAVVGASHRDPPEPTVFPTPVSPSKERRELSAFRNKMVMLHDDLNLSDHLKKVVIDVIERGKGTMTSDIERAHILICQYRENVEFETAVEFGIDIGNLGWLYYVINHNTWTDPTRRLLHYPFPKEGIAGFETFKIAISNYTGDARVYVESLIKAAGGEYTKTMSTENTHLITAHVGSEKSTAAREWGVHMVNHLWLEETYAKGRIQGVTVPRYTTFPSQTNLCEVVGQTQIDRQYIQQTYNGCPPDMSTDENENAAESSSAHSSAPASAKPKSAQKNAETPLPSRFKNHLETPSSRGAKDRALSKLHAMAPDIALYTKESKRVGGVVYGGRRVTDPDRIALTTTPGRKRSSSAADIAIADEEINNPEQNSTNETGPQKKKMKKTKGGVTEPAPTTTEPRLKVMVTGVDKEGSNATSTFRSKLKGLKIQILEDATSEVDVIVAPRIMRTMKFLAGVAAAPAIVNVKWLEDMGKKKQRLPLDEYLLEDAQYEAEYKFSLAEALERARKHKAAGGLLKDRTIFCSDGAKGGFSTYDNIIKANGGKCVPFKGREITVSRTKDRDKENNTEDWMADNDNEDQNEAKNRRCNNDDGEKEYLYLISDEKDRALWPKFQSMALNQGFQSRVVKPDWLLRIAQNQELDEWKDDWVFDD